MLPASETRSGEDPNFYKILTDQGYVTPNFSSNPASFDKIYSQIQEAGQEVGVTTGKVRKIRFLDLNRLINAINSTGTTILVLQKWDILEGVGAYACRYFYNREVRNPGFNMRDEISDIINENCLIAKHIVMSQSPTNDVD